MQNPEQKPLRLVMVYDVTGLDENQIAALEMEAAVQAEAGDEHLLVIDGAYVEVTHPDVPVRSYVEDDPIFVASLDAKTA